MDKVPTHQIRKGQQLYRVLKAEYDEHGNRLYDALEPNPYIYATFDAGSDVKARYQDGTLIPGRFAPFRATQAKQHAVPAVYFAESAIGAYYEIVLRPLGGNEKRTLQHADVADKRLARVVFAGDLNLADVRRAYLQDGATPFWPYSARDLYESSNLQVLTQTRSLARYVCEHYPQLDGLIWDSVQARGPVSCTMLFGKRRNGVVQEEVPVLDDISTWRPYLLDGAHKAEIIVAPDLINLLGL